MAKGSHKNNLTPGGTPQWWTDAKNTQVLPDLRRWRRDGLIWKAIARELRNVVHPATLSEMYRKNFGKLTPKDLVDLYPPEPPNVEPPSRMTIDDLDVAWKKLQDGYPYALVIQILMRRKCFAKERRARDFLNKWLRSAAEDVWGMPAEEMLDRRKKRTRKSTKGFDRFKNLKLPEISTEDATKAKNPLSRRTFKIEIDGLIFEWGWSEGPPKEVLVKLHKIQSKVMSERSEEEIGFVKRWVSAITIYENKKDTLEK